MPALLKKREVALAGLILLLLLGVGLRAPVFLSIGSLTGVASDSAVLVMMALGQMTVLLTRGIDLSVASTLACAGMAVALLGQAWPGMPVPLTMLLSTLVGIGLGSFNGWLIAGLRIPPIVVTLGTLSVYRGMIYILSQGAWVSSDEMAPQFLAFPNLTLLGLTTLVWAAAAVVALAWLVLGHTAVGRSLYALGGNPTAARYAGVRVQRVEMAAYMISGGIAGFCGYLWVARYAIASTEVALGLELTVIAACVIGGISIAGGIGSVAGCVLGALFLGIIGNALPVIQVSPFWQMAISGAIILVAVVVNAREQRRGGKQILPVEGERATA